MTDAQAEARTVLEWLHYQAAKSFPHTPGDCELCEAWETVDSALARLEAAETALREVCDYGDRAAVTIARAALAAGRGDSEPPEGYIVPEGDERCGFVMDACQCMKRKGHDGLHVCAHWGWRGQ